MKRTSSPYRILAILGLVNLLAACGDRDVEVTVEVASEAVPQSEITSSQKPNVIFILADDIGWGDPSVNGQQNFRTPSLDRMADEGINFTDFYAGSAVCGPSRSVLMTGLHAGHTEVRANSMAVPTEDGGITLVGKSLADETVTLAEVMKTAGYRTGIIGKWGLGEIDDSGHPNRQGFDYFYGYLNHVHAHNHFPAFLWHNSEKVEIGNETMEVDCKYCWRFGFEGDITPMENRKVYVEDLLREESLEFIERNREQPFFLFVSLVSPHANNEAGLVDWAHGLEVPLESDEYQQFAGEDWPDTARGYAAMMLYVDRTVGAILDKLEEQGLAQNTIVVFSGDNGPHAEGGYDPDFHDSNGPLQGIKRDLYEGGIRVPTFAWGPGQVPAGLKSPHPAYFGDMMATFAELAGTQAPDGLDSHSFAPTLTGQGEQSAPEYIYWEFYSPKSAQAVRMGKWKALRMPMTSGDIRLFNLDDDIGETTDLAAQHPDIVARAAAIMDANHEPSENWIPEFDPKPLDEARRQKAHLIHEE